MAKNLGRAFLDTQQQTLLINPVPFTWMTPPREMFAPAQITFVQGLDSVGNDFMQKVISTPAGQFHRGSQCGFEYL